MAEKAPNVARHFSELNSLAKIRMNAVSSNFYHGRATSKFKMLAHETSGAEISEALLEGIEKWLLRAQLAHQLEIG